MPAKTARVTLLFPPVCDPAQPYLSLPTLAAYLRRAGYPAVQRDLNAEAFEAFLSPARLRAAHARVARRLAEIEAGPVRGSQAEYDALARADVSAPYLIAWVEEAKRVLRSPVAFYDFERYTWSVSVLKRAMALISAEFYPTHWGLGPFQTRHTAGWAWPAARLLETLANERENPFVGYFREQVVPSLQAVPPDLIGISITYYSQVVPGLTLAREIKRALPATHVCIGGAVMTDLAPQFARNPELLSVMDSVITHEGETALLALVRQLERGGPLAAVPNLVYRDAAGAVARNPLGPVEDVNALPAPDYTGLPFELYLAPEPVFLLATSRGCYWKRCAFCTVSTAVRSACYRPRAKERVKQDLRALRARHGARHVFLSEDSVAPPRLRLFAEVVQDLGGRFNWECETRLEGLSAALCRHIAAAGCRRLIFGLESACQRVLDLMDKGTHLPAVAEALQACAEAGLAVNLQSFIGFPGETREEARETLRFLVDNRHRVFSVAYGQFLLQLGSRVQQSPAAYGVTHIDYPPDDHLATCYNYTVAAGMAPEEAEQVRAAGLADIQRAYSHMAGFHGHDLGPHSFLYLAHYGQETVRRLQAVEPEHVVAPDFARRVPVIPGAITRGLYRAGAAGDVVLLAFDGRSGRVIKTDPDAGSLLDQCDGRASVGDLAARYADGQTRNGGDYLKSYYQALSLVSTCVRSGLCELR